MTTLTYRALGALLSYPTEDLQAATAEIAAAFETEAIIPPPHRAAIAALLHELAATDIYELQERYFILFDRSRSLSLHLFEHIHGEGRDRGQAMADLIALYANHGLQMRNDELPDFLPLFLEFLSLLPPADARSMLAEAATVLRALADRLANRGTSYAAVMQTLADLAQAPTEGASDIPDDDPNDLAALDAAWEEAAVRFGPGEWQDACGSDRLRTRLRAAARDANAASREPPAASHEPPAASHELPAASPDLPPASRDLPPASRDLPATGRDAIAAAGNAAPA
ncbi:MAG TPA: nitrate reductase molybdenum cofactor assembly chaperone [Acetobacteraceae bacterium]|nr:nitrate reductase molybdenum cofactor assembly chaperone [Acetobacteraceae bacterium]